MATVDMRRKRAPLPSWFKMRLPNAGESTQTLAHTTASAASLNTVCEEAKCPNRTSCWSEGTATFMVAGKTCTRNCRFCSVDHALRPEPPDPDEPNRLAGSIAGLRLDYAVITVVNRDDLPDGGATHYRACLDAVSQQSPSTDLEFLGSDLAGDSQALEQLLDGAPLKVFAHNVETVERLTANVRDRKASFGLSLQILKAAKQIRPDLMTKSSLMVGLGETTEDVEQTLKALRDANVDLLTIGQYLAPSSAHYPVVSFPPPHLFDQWQKLARHLGFRAVASGPFVRSSYKAGELYRTALKQTSGPS